MLPLVSPAGLDAQGSRFSAIDVVVDTQVQLPPGSALTLEAPGGSFVAAHRLEPLSRRALALIVTF